MGTGHARLFFRPTWRSASTTSGRPEGRPLPLHADLKSASTTLQADLKVGLYEHRT